MNTLESIRLRAIALRSSIHNEHQLSAIELTAMCAKKTNELIQCYNDLIEYIDSMAHVLNISYDETSESLVIKAEEI